MSQRIVKVQILLRNYILEHSCYLVQKYKIISRSQMISDHNVTNLQITKLSNYFNHERFVTLSEEEEFKESYDGSPKSVTFDIDIPKLFNKEIENLLRRKEGTNAQTYQERDSIEGSKISIGKPSGFGYKHKNTSVSEYEKSSILGELGYANKWKESYDRVDSFKLESSNMELKMQNNILSTKCALIKSENESLRKNLVVDKDQNLEYIKSLEDANRNLRQQTEGLEFQNETIKMEYESYKDEADKMIEKIYREEKIVTDEIKKELWDQSSKNIEITLNNTELIQKVHTLKQANKTSICTSNEENIGDSQYKSTIVEDTFNTELGGQDKFIDEIMILKGKLHSLEINLESEKQQTLQYSKENTRLKEALKHEQDEKEKITIELIELEQKRQDGFDEMDNQSNISQIDQLTPQVMGDIIKVKEGQKHWKNILTKAETNANTCRDFFNSYGLLLNNETNEY